MLSFFLLGIEELGIQLEEPFSVLPLHKITQGIGLSAEEHVQWFLNDDERMTRAAAATKFPNSYTDPTFPTSDFSPANSPPSSYQDFSM